MLSGTGLWSVELTFDQCLVYGVCEQAAREMSEAETDQRGI